MLLAAGGETSPFSIPSPSPRDSCTQKFHDSKSVLETAGRGTELFNAAPRSVKGLETVGVP